MREETVCAETPGYRLPREKGFTVRDGFGQTGPGERVVSIGIFDGVHIGHRAILEKAAEEAARTSALPSVLTFSGIAKAGSDAGGMIFGETEKEEFLFEAGAREMHTVDFSSVREMDCKTFVNEVLIGKLSARAAVVGEDFRFGFRRSGDAETLVSLMRQAGRECFVLPRKTCDGEPVSSTAVRSLLKSGDIEKANRWMGHPMTWILPVVSGSRVGRRIGYPTVNQKIPPERVLPKFGVYVVSADTGNGVFRGVCNVGVKPTFGGTEPLAETYLDGFSGDLYGKTVKLSLCRFLRPERAFRGADELREQIARDIAAAFEGESTS